MPSRKKSPNRCPECGHECEVCLDENGKSYIKIPASSLFDAEAGIREILNIYPPGVLPEGEPDA